jgi:hypothetical protein
MTPLHKRHIQSHMDTIFAADVTKYVAATRARQSAELREEAERDAMNASVVSSRGAIMRHVRKMLEPHYIEWRAYDGPMIDWTNKGTPHVWICGELFPRKDGKHETHASVHFVFQAQPRDVAEFEKIFAGIKAAADAMADAL